MAYTKTVWTNDSGQPLNDTNLNKMEQGIKDAHTGSIIKALYEAEADTNALTDAEKTSVGTISSVTSRVTALEAGVVKLKTVTTTHSIAITEAVLLCEATSGAFTITLPDPSTAYSGANLTSLTFTISKIDTSANAITIAPFGAETIGGDASFDLLLMNESIELVTDGTNWYIKG